ncbi:hypothetical protein EDC94DRAFT_221325 [Helicostylum pulchrum]|nr:hypothetical protein EDC94DRAFT_221325 [Helicostylum pulchrum]
MFQIAVIAGKVKDLDSYLLPIVDEVKSLGERGLIVKKHNGEIIKSKVHMIASGDIPQVINKKKVTILIFYKYIHHKGHRAHFGCRICSVKDESSSGNAGVMYYKDSNASLRW